MPIIILFLVCACWSQDSVITISKIERVYDGDTFYSDLYNLPDIFGKNIGIRLVGIDTPEMRSTDSCNRALAQAAKAYLTERLMRARKIELRNVSRDKYFRLDAVVFADSVNINQEMIDKGYAQPYTGEGPKPTHTCR